MQPALPTAHSTAVLTAAVLAVIVLATADAAVEQELAINDDPKVEVDRRTGEEDESQAAAYPQDCQEELKLALRPPPASGPPPPPRPAPAPRYRLYPLNDERNFVANAVIRACFDMGNRKSSAGPSNRKIV